MSQAPNWRFIRHRSASQDGWRDIGAADLDISWDFEYEEPAGGFPPVKMPRPFPGANWDHYSWPQLSKYPPGETATKGVAKRMFLLNDKDMIDLCYTKSVATIPNPCFPHPPQKNYLCTQLERRAWEKYGGPLGLQEAQYIKAARGFRRNLPMPPLMERTHVPISQAAAPAVDVPFNILDWEPQPEHEDLHLGPYVSSPTPGSPIDLQMHWLSILAGEAGLMPDEEKTHSTDDATTPAVDDETLLRTLRVSSPQAKNDVVDLTMDADPVESTSDSKRQKGTKGILSEDDDDIVIVSFTSKKELLSARL